LKAPHPRRRSRPAILDQINREIANSEPDFAHLAALISSDVALSASLIKVANWRNT
jgi:HD-like signal output (HDOD) protein